MRVSRWVPKTTHTLSEYVILIAFLSQQWLLESASTLCYTYTACLFTFSSFLPFLFLRYHPFFFVSFSFFVSLSIVSQSSSLCVARRSSAHICNIFNRNVYTQTSGRALQKIFVWTDGNGRLRGYVVVGSRVSFPNPLILLCVTLLLCSTRKQHNKASFHLIQTACTMKHCWRAS